MRRRIISPTGQLRLLGFVAFWAALAVWACWLLGATGVVSWSADGLSVDLPWYGWLVLLAWATWLVGVIVHQWISQAAHPSPAAKPTSLYFGSIPW